MTLGLGDLAFVGALGPAYDPSAQAYITAVETADGQGLETAVKDAINAFVVGCKADGIWNAIKASCILAGARTLSGALVPLVGAAPANFNFASGDYNRKTGLAGNGSTKFLNSNRTASSDPQNSRHLAIHASTALSNSGIYIGAESQNHRNSIYGNAAMVGFSLSAPNVDSSSVASSSATGLIAASRSGPNLTQWRATSSTGAFFQASASSVFPNIAIFARNDNGSITNHANVRLAFYSIGESLDLALLDARVTALINAFAAAIP
ncbi:MAG: Cyanophage [Cyanobacteriota bacterium]